MTGWEPGFRRRAAAGHVAPPALRARQIQAAKPVPKSWSGSLLTRVALGSTLELYARSTRMPGSSGGAASLDAAGRS
jgi:hypothetical protein